MASFRTSIRLVAIRESHSNSGHAAPRPQSTKDIMNFRSLKFTERKSSWHLSPFPSSIDWIQSQFVRLIHFNARIRKFRKVSNCLSRFSCDTFFSTCGIKFSVNFGLWSVWWSWPIFVFFITFECILMSLHLKIKQLLEMQQLSWLGNVKKNGTNCCF